jgi:hypothetical protein
MAGVLTGGPQGATLGLYASSYVQLKDQMNTPEFQDVPENIEVEVQTAFTSELFSDIIYGMEEES